MFGAKDSECLKCGGSKEQHDRMIRVGFEMPHAWVTERVDKLKKEAKRKKDEKRRRK